MAAKFRKKITGAILSVGVFATITLLQNPVLSEVYQRENNLSTQTDQI
ncbi:MAG: hypothetical protein ACHBN1_15480 [Heteroscytonema crispum UTEX LB 1556]